MWSLITTTILCTQWVYMEHYFVQLEGNGGQFLVETEGRKTTKDSSFRKHEHIQSSGGDQKKGQSGSSKLTADYEYYKKTGNPKSEAKHSACFIGPSDHHPLHLRKVFMRPKHFLKGPLAKSKKNKMKEKHFVIVGAGMAGLTSAYLLLKMGHKVTLLESSDRAGGRVYTYYGDGYYGDMGAMRYPPSHHVLHTVLKHFKIPTTRFTNTWETDSSYLFVRGKHYNARKDLGMIASSDPENMTHPFNAEKLMELYELFNVKNPPRDENGELRHILDLKNEIGRAADLNKLCQDDRTYATFLREGLAERNADPNLMNLWVTLGFNRPFLGHTALHMVIERKQKKMKSKEERNTHYVEIVNGAQVLPTTIFTKLKKFKKFDYKFDMRVDKVVDTTRKVSVISTNNITVSGDYAIVTPPARSVALMTFDPPLPYMKEHAIDSLNYWGSVKIFLKFTRPFWAYKNKLPIIRYGNMSTVNGAVGISDDILRQTYYPSNDLHGPVILASYTWEHDSEIFVSMSDEECIEQALKILEERHGSVVRETYETGVVQKWALDNHIHGAFVVPNSYQQIDFVDHLMASHGRVSFAGEYANKMHHGWIEAALQSAFRNLIKMWPEQFEQDYGQAEADFFGGADEPGMDYQDDTEYKTKHFLPPIARRN